MFGNSFLISYAISYLIVGVLGSSLAFFVFFSPSRNAVKTAFAKYLLAVSWWALFSVPMLYAPSEMWGTYWDRICLIGLIFIPVGFINFNFVFLGIDEKYKKFINLNYFISFLFLLANYTPLFLKSTSPRFNLNYFTDPGPLYYLFFGYFVLLSILGVAAFYRGYIRETGNRKLQLLYLFWSSLFGYSLGGLNYFIVFKIPPDYFGLIGNYGIVFHMIVYAYIITKHRLMDISVIISRLVAEIMTVIFLGSLYLILIWFYKTYSSSLIDVPFIIWTVCYGILVGQTHQRIRTFIQTTSDKLFLKGKYNYYNELSDISIKVGEKLSLPAILKLLYQSFSDVVEVTDPRIFLPQYFTEADKKSTRYVVFSRRTYLPDPDGEEIPFDDPLIKKLCETRAPIHSPFNPSRELIVPCLLEDRLIAVFILGNKMSEDPYTPEDVRLIKALASQAAVALDHTRSYVKIKADLEIAERELERSQRLASLGILVAGVTHEIRNPLTVIRSETERLANETRDQKYLKDYRDLLLKHVDRIANIVQRMLTLAEEKPRQEVDVDLNASINMALQLVRLEGITPRKELGDIPLIKGDPGQMEEVFVNLIQNAISSMPQGGDLTLRTYKKEGKTIAEVSDTGKGIPLELREKIFDPFFSTRHEGVGLGLSIVYRIIREHDAKLELSSEVGKGSTFRVIF